MVSFQPHGATSAASLTYREIEVLQLVAGGADRMLVGPAINHASRIGRAGTGNRCLVGPVAAGMPGFSKKSLRGPLRLEGNDSGSGYTFYEVEMADFWLEGRRKKDRISHLP